LNGSLASMPARSMSLARPDVENGAPRSLTKVKGDLASRFRGEIQPPRFRRRILAAEKPSAIDLEALQASESEGLLAQLVTQRARLQTHSELASELGDVKAAVACERAITSNLELVGKLLGTLIQRTEVRSTSILISADYLDISEGIAALS
jgi:hypothetical protein